MADEAAPAPAEAQPLTPEQELEVAQEALAKAEADVAAEAPASPVVADPPPAIVVPSEPAAPAEPQPEPPEPSKADAIAAIIRNGLSNGPISQSDATWQHLETRLPEIVAAIIAQEA